MDMWQGKHFSITDPKDVRTVIYQVNKTEKEFLPDSPKFTIQRLDFSEELRGENTRKTFYIDDPSDNEDQLVILSFGKERVVVNMALLEGNKISISDLIDNLHVKKDVKNNLKNLYYCFEDKIFGNIDIQKQLKVNKNTATSYIKFLKNNNIIEPVADYSKGKYKFK